MQVPGICVLQAPQWFSCTAKLGGGGRVGAPIRRIVVIGTVLGPSGHALAVLLALPGQVGGGVGRGDGGWPHPTVCILRVFASERTAAGIKVRNFRSWCLSCCEAACVRSSAILQMRRKKNFDIYILEANVSLSDGFFPAWTQFLFLSGESL